MILLVSVNLIVAQPAARAREHTTPSRPLLVGAPRGLPPNLQGVKGERSTLVIKLDGEGGRFIPPDAAHQIEQHLKHPIFLTQEAVNMLAPLFVD